MDLEWNCSYLTYTGRGTQLWCGQLKPHVPQMLCWRHCQQPIFQREISFAIFSIFWRHPKMLLSSYSIHTSWWTSSWLIPYNNGETLVSLAFGEYNQSKVIKQEGLKKVAFAKKTLFSANWVIVCIFLLSIEFGHFTFQQKINFALPLKYWKLLLWKFR